MSHTFYWNRRPSIRNCGGVGGCTTEFSGELEPEKNTSYYRRGVLPAHFHASRASAVRLGDSQQPPEPLHDRVRPLVHGRQFAVGRRGLAAGAVWRAIRAASSRRTRARPSSTFGGNTPYSTVGQNWTRFGYLVNNRWQFSNDLTWVKSRHTMKFGFEYRNHNFPFRGWGAGEGGQFNFNRLGTAGLRCGRQQPRRDGRSLCLVPARSGPGFDSDHRRPSDVQRGVHGPLGERRVQGVEQR